jgi:hypothetical protein
MTVEEAINRIMEARKMLPNASYFAFTATPKNKTLEVFGEPHPTGDKVQHRPFHSLFHEAGDPGGVHPGRAPKLHDRQ